MKLIFGFIAILLAASAAQAETAHVLFEPAWNAVSKELAGIYATGSAPVSYGAVPDVLTNCFIRYGDEADQAPAAFTLYEGEIDQAPGPDAVVCPPD